MRGKCLAVRKENFERTNTDVLPRSLLASLNLSGILHVRPEILPALVTTISITT
jgi:hypothetical protein